VETVKGSVAPLNSQIQVVEEKQNLQKYRLDSIFSVILEWP